ncbi:hypothetical protein CP532_1037 [Ophiocordyceps camponoti-leonardi (nom. inval.)]|nr:hypothetical protein CP532_1037 [Ophiocordyceps camponoti-leonardi (nom. inval.)]
MIEAGDAICKALAMRVLSGRGRQGRGGGAGRIIHGAGGTERGRALSCCGQDGRKQESFDDGWAGGCGRSVVVRLASRHWGFPRGAFAVLSVQGTTAEGGGSTGAVKPVGPRRWMGGARRRSLKILSGYSTGGGMRDDALVELPPATRRDDAMRRGTLRADESSDDVLIASTEEPPGLACITCITSWRYP